MLNFIRIVENENCFDVIACTCCDFNIVGKTFNIRYSAFVKDIFDKLLIKGFLGYCAYIIRYALTVGIACNGRLIFIKAAVIY